MLSMPVPDFQSLMLPVLNALADGAEAALSEVRQRVASAEGLTPEDVRETTPEGRQPRFSYNVSWAAIYMERAGLVARVRRGVYRLTEEGERLLGQSPTRVDMDVLSKYATYVEWKRKAPPSNGGTPEGALARAVRQLTEALQAEVLHRVLEAPPAFLEQIVVDLLIAMGYGGGDASMGRVTGRTGDGGIDGTIREDALGLDEVYVQAKKYADGKTVGEAELRNFAGAIDAAGTAKGVFVTTSRFTDAAKQYVARSPKRIVLIDGEELARLMVERGVGVRLRDRYEVKGIDEDYFDV